MIPPSDSIAGRAAPALLGVSLALGACGGAISPDTGRLAASPVSPPPSVVPTAVAPEAQPLAEPLPTPSVGTRPGAASPLPAPVAPGGRIILSHTPAQQSFSASCEAAAAALAMRVAGHPVSERDVIAALAADARAPELSGRTVVRWGNPSKAFVGQQDGWWPWARYDPAHPTGYGVYAPPVMDALHRLGAPSAHGGSGISLAALKQAVRAHHPVVVWLPSRHDFERVGNALATASWTAWDGTNVTYALHEHTQTLLGVDDAGFFVGTPDYQWTPGYPFLSYWTDAEFGRAFAFLGNMAIIVE